MAARVIRKPGRTVKRLRKDSNKGHLIPLSSVAVALIAELARYRKPGVDLVFTTTSDTPISGFSKARNALDEIITAARAAKGLPPLEHWTPHDFRRTYSTGLLRLRLASRDAVDALTGHVLGVRAVYQRYGFEAELAEAAEGWAKHVVGLVDGWPVARRRLSMTAALDAWDAEHGEAA